VFRDWKAAIRDAAKVPNLVLKLGGLGMQFSSPSVYGRNPPPTSIELAALWKPFIETCIEAFGVQRCMFESNFPPDGGTAPYGVFWNAFKRITEHASDAERAALFSGTAKRIYRLG
jgi:predicted TIM-barrel fold metal-dependent hydrolase